VIRSAIVFDFKNWAGDFAVANPDTLLLAVQRLFALLDERKVDYVLVGGVALLAYVEGRNTQDIDLIMALPALAKLPEINILSQEQDFARGELEGLQIDILFTKNPLFNEVRRKHAAKRKFMEREIPTATVEGLLLLKLYALPSLYRQGNFVKTSLYENDVATLMYHYHPAVDLLIERLRRYMGEGDIAELRGIMKDIEQRLARFRKSAP